MDKISEFRGQYKWLSNFWICDVMFGGFLYRSVEHAYQAAKTPILEQRLEVSKAPTPAQAKQIGRLVYMYPDWNERRIEVMRLLLQSKFSRQNPELVKRLLETGDVELVEGNYWNDTFWGVCRGKGENQLGKLIMNIRSDLTKQEKHDV